MCRIPPLAAPQAVPPHFQRQLRKLGEQMKCAGRDVLFNDPDW